MLCIGGLEVLHKMIMDFLSWLWCILKSFFYFIIEKLLTILDIIAQFVLLILPDSPFDFKPVDLGDFGNIVGFFIPVSTLISHFLGILTAISFYYGVRYLLRLIRQVQ